MYRLRKNIIYMDRFVKTAKEICLDPNNFNSNEVFTFRPAWQLITKLLQLRKEAPKLEQVLAQQSLKSTR